MSRKSFLESNYYIHSTNSLSKLRGSLTKYDMSSTERFNNKSNHRSMNQSLDFPSVLRNSNMKNRQSQSISSKPSILKKLFKSNSKNNHISQSKYKQISYNSKNQAQTHLNKYKLELQSDFKNCIDRLDHSKHSHIGEKQCFIGYKCFISIMSEMGYLSNWKVDNGMIDSIWKDLGGEDNQGFLKSNLLLVLEIIEGINDLIQSRVRSFNTQQYQIRTEKNSIIYNRYKTLRQNRTQYKKDQKVNVLSMKSSNKQQIQQTNLTKLRKSLINKNNQNGIKYPIKLRKRDKTQGDKRLCETLKTENRIQNKSHTSKRAHLRLDVQPKQSEYNSINDKQNRNSFDSRVGMVQRNKTQNLHNNHHSRCSQQYQDQKQDIPINTNLDYQRKALLSLDINLGDGKTQKIIIYQGDTPKKIAQDISRKHSLSQQISFKFQKILQNHLNSFLQKIQEVQQVTEDFISFIPNH